MLKESDSSILRLLTDAHAAGRPLRVEEVAAALRVTPGFASQRLRRMESEGLVARTQKAVPQGRVVYYLPLPWASVRWSSPKEGMFLEWVSAGEIDWSFPLASQIPDPQARETVHSFLTKLRIDGLLDARKGFKPSWSKLRESDYQGLTIVHFGSTARGKARAGADVDLLCFHSESLRERLRRIEDQATDTTLEGRRPIQLFLVEWQKRTEKVPSWISEAVKTDGIVLYDGLRGPRRSPVGIWRLVKTGLAR
ncbi:MAG: MarR family transcriptional regulator [Euryarchaeota archaeon]|nr:MarR family transcriptional regulator [Euryarchaeota archaeon]